MYPRKSPLASYYRPDTMFQSQSRPTDHLKTKSVDLPFAEQPQYANYQANNASKTLLTRVSKGVLGHATKPMQLADESTIMFAATSEMNKSNLSPNSVPKVATTKSKKSFQNLDSEAQKQKAIGMQEASILSRELARVESLSKGVLHGRTVTPEGQDVWQQPFNIDAEEIS